MKKQIIIYIFFLILFSSCDNIFAPKLDNSISTPIISDQTTVDGVFKNFKYAYTFKDTSVYSNLFTEDFIFTYRDYTLGYDISWDKPTELRTTNGLFQNSQKLEIIWNNIVLQLGDSVHQTLKRSFNLTITFNPSNIIRLNGFADMSLIKNATDNKWRIYKWKDESF